MEVIVFGDVEDALRLHLDEELDGYAETAPVSCSIPDPRPP